MKKLTSLKELTSEQKMLKEVKDLLLLDGWKEITEDFDNKFALVFTVYGEIVTRYITWDSEYSEWHGCSFRYPAFWLTNKCSWHEDIDDCTIGLVASFDVPLRTQNTIKALKIMEDFQHEND